MNSLNYLFVIDIHVIVSLKTHLKNAFFFKKNSTHVCKQPLSTIDKIAHLSPHNCTVT